MSYKKLMGMNDYKGLSSLFKDNGDIEGISSSEVFNTLLMIDKINNPLIKEHFLLQYKDKYITKNEYKIIKEEIKNYLLESQK